jgi:hypothetical protein
MIYKGYKGCGPKRLGTSPLKQTDHERLAEIKLTRERLNKPKHKRTKTWAKLPKVQGARGGAGALEMLGGASVIRGFNLSKRLKMVPVVDVKIKDD